ncbi:MAG: ABC transporter ATP-binding protein [Chloroflexi bacterium]|nr:ABC transporter ATP-binding protein [Chloroflexota bacterium]
MLRLRKFLKPYTTLILLSIILLFVQAMSELSLPDYMAHIVNNGIQQGGIDTAVPSAIRQSTLDKLVVFLSEEDKAAVLSAYTLIDPATAEGARLVEQYPAAADEPVLVFDESRYNEDLNHLLGRAFAAVTGMEQMMADPEAAATVSGQAGAMLATLPEGTDIFEMLGSLPAALRQPIMDTLEARFETLGDTMTVQAGISAVKAEYEALGMDTAGIQNAYIVRTGAAMLGLSLLSGAASVTVGLLSARTAAGSARDVRRAIFRKVQGFSNAELDRFSTASLITRSTNDVNQLQMVIIMLIRIVCFAPILGIGGILKAMQTDASMWWIIALAVVILLTIIFTVFSVALPKFRIVQSLIDRLNLVARENLSGIMVVRAFNTQAFEEQRFDKANHDLLTTTLFINRIMVIMMPMMMLIMNGLSLLIIWVGAHQVAASAMRVGDMMAFLQYSMQVVMSFLMMSMMFIILPRASVSGGRIAEVLEVEPTIRDPQPPKRFGPTFEGAVEFRNVTFRYPGAEEDVLHDLSFTARPGETTAFIGATGSGKSTLTNLIPRFYDVTEGAILIDGVDIREVTQHDLRDKIGYVPQRASLFSGTIESNLRYADEDVSEAVLQESIAIAQAADFIDEKPEKLAADIAQGGINVSGGQRQRLSIARALVKRAPILIFDDSFSALDFRTDAALRRALKQKTAGATVLIVTQRVSTIRNAEQIVVLDDGRIVGKGTHEELMDTCEVYREIALSQLGMEELAR